MTQLTFLDPIARNSDPATSHMAAAEVLGKLDPRAIDITGQRFGRLIALRYLTKGKWLFKCDCGTEKAVGGRDVRSGKVQSCGCYNREQAARNGRKRRRHGARYTRAWIIWFGMKQRCFYKKHKTYHKYGGAGITVCERWLTFDNFLADMGQPPSKIHTLDRHPNGEGNYEPGNCRWATPTEQSRNQKSNRLLTIDGVTKCVTEWWEDPCCTVSHQVLSKRLENGWPDEAAVKLPLHSKRPTGTQSPRTTRGVCRISGKQAMVYRLVSTEGT